MKKYELLVPIIVGSALLIEMFVPRPIKVEAEPIIEISSYCYEIPQSIEPEIAATEVTVEPRPIYYDIPLTFDEQDYIRNVSSQFGIEFEVVLAVCKTETNFTINSIGDNGNSFGIMQIQPQWWSHFFYENDCSDWLSLKDNVTVGCAILQYLYENYGDTRRVLNAYNTSNPDWNNGYSDKVLSNLADIKENVTDEKKIQPYADTCY